MRLSDDGYNHQQIAHKLRISRQRVSHLLRRFNMPRHSGTLRRFGGTCRLSAMRTVHKVSETTGLRPSVVLSMMVESLAADGAERVQKYLGKRIRELQP
mgnify:FL=1